MKAIRYTEDINLRPIEAIEEDLRVVRINDCKLELGRMSKDELSNLLESRHAALGQVMAEIGQVEAEILRRYSPELIGSNGNET